MNLERVFEELRNTMNLIETFEGGNTIALSGTRALEPLILCGLETKC